MRPDVKMAAILQLSQYCTFKMDSISTVITEPGQPVTSSRSRAVVLQASSHPPRSIRDNKFDFGNSRFISDI